ncbi:MAG TPA: ADP-ribosylation factor-like protein [Candidatus Lokiarchaeia archaeon]
MAENLEKEKLSKILIMGLDNSGKTSILISLSKDSNLLSYCSLKPTKGVKIQKYETQEELLSVWDFGGQEQYREEYLTNFKKYIDKVEKIIFVIDVQDVKRYEDSLNYLEDIINLLKHEVKMVELSIFLHKYDPNISEMIEKIEELIKTDLLDKVKSLIPKDFKYEIYRTTIYTVFEKILI